MYLPYPDGTALKGVVQTGDLIFTASSSSLAKIIRRITEGKVSHVKMVMEDKVFETDGKYGKALYTELPEVMKEGMVIMQSAFLTDEQRSELPALAKKYEGIPYDYIDVALNLILSPFSHNIRKGLITFFGTKHMMKCDELAMRMLYEVSLRPHLKWYEGNVPQSFLNITLNDPQSFRLLYWNP